MIEKLFNVLVLSWLVLSITLLLRATMILIENWYEKKYNTELFPQDENL
jgi:hypothetical protein